MAQACAHGGRSFTPLLSPAHNNVQYHSVQAANSRLRPHSNRVEFGRVRTNCASHRSFGGPGGVVRLQSCGGVLLRRGAKRWRVMMSVEDDDALPTQEDIIAAAKERGVVMELKATGPLFAVIATDLAGEKIGTSDGFIKPWVDSNILHLDSIRLTKASATRTGRSIFGAGVYMGALMVRHGIDCACVRGELMAINDSDEYHRKLVRYYSRLGWRPVYEVKGDSWRDYVHMLVWGGVGTRMDTDLRELLGKWAKTMKTDLKKKSLVKAQT